MIEVTRTQLLPGVHLTAVQTQKFKSSVLGMQFLLPLSLIHISEPTRH